MATRVLLLQLAGGHGVSGTTTKVLRGKGRIGVGVWRGRVKVQEKAEQVRGRWRSNLMAKERVGPASKGDP